MQAHGLEDGLGVLERLLLHVPPEVLGEELAVVFQSLDVIQAGGQLGLVHAVEMAVLLHHPGNNLVAGGGLEEGDAVVGYVVHQMDGAAVHVQDDVVSVEFVLMDHR